MRFIVGAFVTICTAATTVAALGAPAFDCQPGRVAILTNSGVVTFDVEIADTADERARGLMFRRDLASNHGMLFVYEEPQAVSFWMRNTYIPLDMIFVNARGVIRHIGANARPLDETPIPGAAPGDPAPERLMVLEIGGGEAARRNLAPGQPLASPFLDQDNSVWPCKADIN